MHDENENEDMGVLEIINFRFTSGEDEKAIITKDFKDYVAILAKYAAFVI